MRILTSQDLQRNTDIYNHIDRKAKVRRFVLMIKKICSRTQNIMFIRIKSIIILEWLNSINTKYWNIVRPYLCHGLVQVVRVLGAGPLSLRTIAAPLAVLRRGLQRTFLGGGDLGSRGGLRGRDHVGRRLPRELRVPDW
mgnify:CR=1 FL=1